MPALIPYCLQLAHDQKPSYIVRVETEQHKTKSGKSWAKPYYKKYEVISPKEYFNNIFTAYTHKLIRVDLNYTYIGYVVTETCMITSDTRYHTDYYIYRDAEDAKANERYYGELGNVIVKEGEEKC